MEELIPVRNKNGELLVSARDLHETLKIEKAFSTWIQSQLESIDAVENVDFIPLKEESTGGRPSIEYVLKLDTAKEICMVVGVAPRANSETKKLSKQVRKYLHAAHNSFSGMNFANLILPFAMSQSRHRRIV